MSNELWEAACTLRDRVERLSFDLPVTHVYNPLSYAARPHRAYIERFGGGTREVVALGMNPGPWGMAQTGVPFGDPTIVREWLGIHEPVERPVREQPRRPVLGCDSPRGEVSGQRLWGAIRAHFGAPERFFRRFYIANYCPLCFMEESGRNRTPDKLPRPERDPLLAACDEHLLRVVAILQPRWVVGIGTFAAGRAQEVLQHTGVRVGRILHPSPASPLANRDWAGTVRRELLELGICVDGADSVPRLT